ncbi:MAG: hypothetical protein ABSD47_16880 [Candidatus Methylomirabilota bacterium]|jgi:hypothetical protein
MSRVFAQWRRKFDVPDPRFDQLVQDLRVPLPISAIARSLVQEGHLAHMHPTTIRIYLTRFRDAAGFPKYMDQPEEEKADESDEPIEGEPALKRLRWLTRIQHARVRKGLRMEGMMGGLTLATTADDIKLLSSLIDKELEVALKTGEMKTVPQAVKLDIPGIPIHEPAEAMRVVLAYRRIKALLAARTAESRGPTGEEAPGSDSAGAASIDGRVDDGGGDAAGTPLPGAAGSGPVGPGPGAEGEHGRT